MSQEWDEVGFLISSEYRLSIVARLGESPSTPTEIADDTGLAISHVSNTLSTLLDRSIVALTVPEEQYRNRIYELTEKGRKLWRRIREAGLDE